MSSSSGKPPPPRPPPPSPSSPPNSSRRARSARALRCFLAASLPASSARRFARAFQVGSSWRQWEHHGDFFFESLFLESFW